MAITSAASKVPRTSGVTARQVIKKMPSEPLSEDRDGNLLCEAFPWTFPKGGIFSYRVVAHVSCARHKKKLKNWLGHKARRADIRAPILTTEEGRTLGSDLESNHRQGEISRGFHHSELIYRLFGYKSPCSLVQY